MKLMFFKAKYTGLFFSELLLTPSSTPNPPPPINPNTRINISGNNNVKTTAEGLRVMERKLALAIANIARTWL
jgi:hypothetical protein